MNESVAHSCYICGGPILGLMTNWKGHNVHPHCSVACMSAAVEPTPGCLAEDNGATVTPFDKNLPQVENSKKRIDELTRINDIFRKRLQGDPDVHMLSLARTLKLDGFTWCRVVTETIGRINRAEKKLEEIGYRRDGEHWLPLKVKSAEQVKPGDPIPPGWVHQTVFVDPAFYNADKSIAGVMFRFPVELVGPDSPDSGPILKEVQAVAELLLTKAKLSKQIKERISLMALRENNVCANTGDAGDRTSQSQDKRVQGNLP